MYKSLLVFFCFYLNLNSLMAQTWEIPEPANCPQTLEELEKNKEWVSHENSTEEELLKNADNALKLLTHTISSHRVETVLYQSIELPLIDNTSGLFTFPGIARTNQSEQNLKENSLCSIIGVFARFVELDDPGIFYKDIPGKEFELMNAGKIALYEIRWFDVKDKKRHRWINTLLTTNLGWYSPRVPELEETPINSLY